MKYERPESGRLIGREGSPSQNRRILGRKFSQSRERFTVNTEIFAVWNFQSGFDFGEYSDKFLTRRFLYWQWKAFFYFLTTENIDWIFLGTNSQTFFSVAGPHLTGIFFSKVEKQISIFCIYKFLESNILYHIMLYYRPLPDMRD